MSAQYAMMGASMAGSIISAFGSKKAADAQAESMKRQGQDFQLQASMNDLQLSGAELSGAQKEKQLRRSVLSILSTNEAAGGNKGIGMEGGTSFDVIQRHNVAAADEDISIMRDNLKTMRVLGEARSQRLSFRAEDAFAASSGMKEQGWFSLASGLLGGTVKAYSLGSWGKGSDVDPRDIARGA